MLLLGGAILARCRRALGARRFGMAAGALAALIGLLTLVEDFVHVDLGIDTLLAPDRGTDSLFPGRMSLFMAVGTVLLGTGAALASRPRKRGRLDSTERLALGGLLLGLGTLLGHIYHTRFLVQLDPSYGSIAPGSTAGLIAGSLALLLLHPTGPLMSLVSSTSFAGREARRLGFMYAPLLLAVAALLTSWESAGAITDGEASALRTLVFLLAMLAFGWRAFRDLDRAEFSLNRALKSGEKIRTELQAEVMQRTTALTATSLKAEAARAQLQAVMESAPDLVAAIDSDFNYVVANRAYMAAFRDDHASGAQRRAWERALAGERFTSEDELAQPDGSACIYERSFGPVKDGRGHVIGAVGLLRNITARRALEHEASASRRLLETVLHHSPAGVFVKEANGRYLLANQVFGRMTGLAPTAIPGCTDEDLFVHTVAEQARTSDLWALEHGAPHEREVVLDVPDGGQRSFLVSKAPMPDGQGGWWICGVATDITERKLAEAALQRSELDLAGRNKDLETLLHVISHDLKEPLRSIESFSSLLTTRHAGQLDPKGLDFLERVVKATGRLGQLLTEIQLLSRARRAEPAQAQVDGREVVQEVLERLDSAIREASATVQVEGELPRLKVERVWATQALYNLVANALKFRRPGAPVEIRVAAWQKDGLAGFQVLDRGPGVPPDQSERIFQLFQRGVGREIPGTGAGLAIVRQIAERHGGRAWVEPRQGGGSVFTVTFAAEEGRAA
ncbi:MAG TPA: PAS domain-containing protein [Gemmatimonadales bacterium]|nr:PAS domain-containing protein [Gemmatimonadales bacterium]